MYKLVIEKYVLKQLAKITPADIVIIKQSIASLASNPRPLGYIKLKGTEAYRIRTGDYRIIYEIHEKIVTIVVIGVGHRKDIYRKL